MRPFLAWFLVASTLTIACSPKRVESSGPEKRYALSGEIISLDTKAQTANINAAAIPNYMEAMAMDYPVKSPAEFSSLHVGDKIKGTLHVTASGDEYYVSEIQKQGPGNK